MLRMGGVSGDVSVIDRLAAAARVFVSVVLASVTCVVVMLVRLLAAAAPAGRFGGRALGQ